MFLTQIGILLNISKQSVKGVECMKILIAGGGSAGHKSSYINCKGDCKTQPDSKILLLITKRS